MRARATWLVIAVIAGCGRIGFDPRASAPPPPPRAVCFGPRIDLALCDSCSSPSPVSPALADLDGDGDLDLVVGDDQLGRIGVRFNDGSGRFGPSMDYTVDYDAQDIALRDVTGDGTLDLLAASWNSSVKLFRGLGGGRFGLQERASNPTTPVAIELADLDRDGDPDLITGGEDNMIRTYLNDGTGTFVGPTSLLGLDNYYDVAVADLDRDGGLDIVTTDSITTLTVLHHTAALTWAPAPIQVASGATGIAIADWNGDGILDLATAATSGSVELLLGDGSATTWTSRLVDVGPAPVWLAEDDLDRDGDRDLVVTQIDGGSISVLINQGDATFEPRRDLPLIQLGGSSIHSLAKTITGDLDGDGYADLVTANPAGENVEIFLTGDPGCP